MKFWKSNGAGAEEQGLTVLAVGCSVVSALAGVVMFVTGKWLWMKWWK